MLFHCKGYVTSHLLCLLGMTCVRNCLPSSSKLVIKSDCNFWNHPLAMPFRVNGKARYAISPGNSCKVVWTLRVSKCLTGSLDLSYRLIYKTLNFKGRGTTIITTLFDILVMLSRLSTDDDVPTCFAISLYMSIRWHRLSCILFFSSWLFEVGPPSL